jgi:hypothetical protein
MTFWLNSVLGPECQLAIEAAFGADLSDVDGSGWTWTDISTDARHDPGIPITVGRGDNVSQAGAASFSAVLNNSTGNYTPGNPTAAHTITQNTPIRERITLLGFPSIDWITRFQGYLDSANPVTDQSAKVKGVAITALGALGRLGGQKKPLKSPLTRAIPATSPAAWWPMEEGSSSVNFASAITGVAALTIVGALALGSDAGPGASASADFAGGGHAVASVNIPVTTSFRYSYSIRIDSEAIAYPMTVTMADGAVWEMFLNTGAGASTGTLQNFYIGPTGSSFFGANTWTLNVGTWYSVITEVSTSGADATAHTWVTSAAGQVELIDTFTGAALHGPILTAALAQPSGGTTNTFAAFHLTQPSIWAPWSSTVHIDQAAIGYSGETADNRLTRLCGEQGIALDLTGTSDVTMGPQSVDTILNLLRECEAADHGVLFDGFGPGVGYQCRSARYNAASVLTLDMGANPPQVTTFAPIFDKQAVKNLYTVTRKNGGSATSEKTDGPLGTDLIGVEDAAATVNTDTDTTLHAHGGWLVSLGTVPGFRFPGTGLNMRGIASLAAGVLGVSIGDRITIHRPASKATDLPPDDIDLIVEGWTETTSASTWALALNCSPYAPNIIATINDTVGRIDSADSVVHLDATTTATTISVSGTLPWTTAAGDMPFDIGVTGERMTVTGVTGASPPQTFAVTRSVNGVVKAHVAASNEPVRVWTPLVIGL